MTENEENKKKELAGLLATTMGLMQKHGTRSEEVLQFIREHKVVPEFVELGATLIYLMEKEESEGQRIKYLACHGCTFGDTPAVATIEATTLADAKAQAVKMYADQNWKGTIQLFLLSDVANGLGFAKRLVCFYPSEIEL